MLFQMINALHQEIAELRKQVERGAAHHHEVEPEYTPVHVEAVPVTHAPVANHAPLHEAVRPQADDFAQAEEYVEESLSIDDQEKRLIQKALERSHGRRKKAAEELHISERTLYRKIKEYGLEE